MILSSCVLVCGGVGSLTGSQGDWPGLTLTKHHPSLYWVTSSLCYLNDPWILIGSKYRPLPILGAQKSLQNKEYSA